MELTVESSSNVNGNGISRKNAIEGIMIVAIIIIINNNNNEIHSL
jgi:hypothetical protein